MSKVQVESNGYDGLLLQNDATLADWSIQNGTFAGGTPINNLPTGWGISSPLGSH